MKVTKLEVQKNDPNRANLYVDGAFALGIHQELILKYELHKGCELTPEELGEIEEADGEMKARSTALEYLAHKQRTCEEVRERLQKEAYPSSAIQKVVDRMGELGYLDDRQYARDYVRARFRNRGYGPYRIRRELHSRGVDDTYIEEALAWLDPEDVREKAYQHAQKKWKKTTSDPPAKRRRKTTQYLRRRGFNFDTIRSVLATVDASTS